VGSDKLAMFVQHRRQYLRVPAAVWREFHHRHIGPETEELQRLERMTVLVAGLINLGAPAAGHRLFKRRVRIGRGYAGVAPRPSAAEEGCDY